MKKFSLLTGAAALATIGGVFATFTFTKVEMDSTITSLGGQVFKESNFVVGDSGTIKITSSFTPLTAKVEEMAGDGGVYTMHFDGGYQEVGVSYEPTQQAIDANEKIQLDIVYLWNITLDCEKSALNLTEEEISWLNIIGNMGELDLTYLGQCLGYPNPFSDYDPFPYYENTGKLGKCSVIAVDGMLGGPLNNKNYPQITNDEFSASTYDNFTYSADYEPVIWNYKALLGLDDQITRMISGYDLCLDNDNKSIVNQLNVACSFIGGHPMVGIGQLFGENDCVIKSVDQLSVLQKVLPHLVANVEFVVAAKTVEDIMLEPVVFDTRKVTL